MKRRLTNQQGFSVFIIIGAIAVVIVVVLVIGYFIMQKNKAAVEQAKVITSVPLTEKDPLQTKVGTPECPELDYTGCDNTGDFMTWTDDGVR